MPRTKPGNWCIGWSGASTLVPACPGVAGEGALSALSICHYDGPAEGFPLDFPRQYPVGANITYSRQMLADLGGLTQALVGMGLNCSPERRQRLTSVARHLVGRSGFVLQPSLITLYFRLVCVQTFFTSVTTGLGGHGHCWTVRCLASPMSCVVYCPGWSWVSVWISLGIFTLWIKRRNPLLTEVYYRELVGYVVQALQMLIGSPLNSGVN